jgi:DNA adenine methylase
MLPFLRWAGGKRKLAQLLTDSFPENFWTSESNYFEPFVGGGAVMLHLGNPENKKYVPGARLKINDMNPDLICTYESIKNDVESLISFLENLSKDLSKERYLEVRAQHTLTGVARAARFIYLNKTGFNGLWRVNGKGEYNVPWGQLRNPTIFDPNVLREISNRLQDASISNLDYAHAVNSTKSGDVVYFDPPYIPISDSANFSKYAKADFGTSEQEQLAETIATLKSNSVHVVLSNSDTPLSRAIFGGTLNLYQIEAARAIAAKASSRGTVKEIVGTSYVIPSELIPSGMVPISFL